jgi:F-type H+-transporting ATPase subunit c
MAMRLTHTKTICNCYQTFGENKQKMNLVGVGIGIAGVGIGLGLIGNGALQGMARQPEAIGKLQVQMLIALAFVELMGFLTIFATAGFK